MTGSKNVSIWRGIFSNDVFGALFIIFASVSIIQYTLLADKFN